MVAHKIKINWRQKLSSRKLWALLAALVTSCLVAFNVDAGTTERIAGIFAGAGSCIAYIFAEASVDKKSVSPEDTNATIVEIEGKKYGVNGGGGVLTGWRQIQGNWYYFKTNNPGLGMMQTGWVDDGDEVFYLGSNGVMLSNTECVVEDQRYQFDSEGRCTTLMHPQKEMQETTM